MENHAPQEDQTKDRYGAERYSRNNPPPSIEVASTRLDNLTEEIIRLSCELDEKELDDFERDTDFRDWRVRAIAAKGHMLVEQAYLFRWVDLTSGQRLLSGNAAPEQIGGQPIYQSPEFALLMSSVIKTTNGIIAEFKLDTLRESIPESIDEAQQIKLNLANATLRIQSETARFVREAKSKKLNRNDQRILKEHLQDVMVKLITPKQGEIREFLRKAHQEDNLRTDWRAITAEALRRAQGEGFLLTPTEDDMLNQLEAIFSSKK